MILSNQVKCTKCGDIIFSRNRHDFVSCSCGAVAVDGGMDYLRRVGDVFAMEEMSIEIPDEAYTAAMKAIQWAKDTGRNNLGILCAIAVALRDHGVELCAKKSQSSPQSKT